MAAVHQPPSDLTAQSKAIILRFCAYLNQRDFEDIRLLLDHTATWYVQGRPDKVAYAGTQLAADQINNVSAMLGQFETFTFKVTGITAEGERVAVEAVSDGKGPGRSDQYHNVYMMQFVLAHGKIISVREFLDYFEVEHFLKNRATT